MKIGITTAAPSLKARFDPRFGRAPYFLIIETDDADPDNMDVRNFENNKTLNLPQGSGIQTAADIAGRRLVDVIITGSCGPRTFRILNKAGIEVVLCHEGNAGALVRQYQNNELKPIGDVILETDNII